MSELDSTTVEKPSDIEKDPKGVVRRWVLEWGLSDKREKDWKKDADRILRRYRQRDAKKHSFNILWSNTETLAPAVYNSVPKPDVRRRFKDEEPVGKAVSQVMSRSLEFGLDTTDFNHQIESCVLDMLLPGRAVARVRYVPSLTQVGEEGAEQIGGEALEGYEEVEWEQAPVEHVQWDDFRHGFGKCWDEVQWVGFKHRLTRKELEEKFGEIGSLVKLDSTDDDEIEKEKDDKVSNSFRTAEVWEIWDKDKREVLFIAKNHKEEPLQVIPDPLNLQGFFPIPRPLYAIGDPSSLIPVPLFELYKEQAEELDTISTRINRLIKGLKMRGIYDATLSELSELMRGEDNDLIPAQNVTALLERGGLEKAIWFMPIEQSANVLKILYEQRELTKQVVYEITGIADVIRGASNAQETATAQQIKDKWGSMRLRKMQSEVSRFIRDLIRIQAEIIGEKFSYETLKTMTGVKLPTQQEAESMALQAQQQGQQPPQVITWEQVIQVMRDDKQRTYKIDIETDSTVAASVEGDMQALRELLGGITELVTGLGPAVQLGAMPVEALKELIMVVCRRAKMGNAVEDAFEKIKQPPPPAQEQQPQDNSLQVEQIKQQGEQAKSQFEGQLEQMRLQQESQREQQKTEAQAMIEKYKSDRDSELEAQRLEFDRYKAALDAETKVLVAQISAEAGAQQAKISAETTLQTKAMESENSKTEKNDAEGKEETGQALAVAIEGFTTAIQELRKPRTVVRDNSGRIAGVQ
jgi:hypothetical protein